MSLLMTQENSKVLQPASVIDITAYPFTFFYWFFEPNAGSDPWASTNAEMLQAYGLTTTNDFNIQTRNNVQVVTPDGFTALQHRNNIFGAGNVFAPEWNDDDIPLDVWNHHIVSWESSSDIKFYSDNVLATRTDQRTQNLFNNSSHFDDWYFFGRNSAGLPHPAKFAGAGLMPRTLDARERGLLQRLWPSRVDSLNDGFTWDLDRPAIDLAAKHGNIDMVDNIGDSYTINGADNPPIVFGNPTFRRGGRSPRIWT